VGESADQPLDEEPKIVDHAPTPRDFPCPVAGCNRKLRTQKGVIQHVAMKHVEYPD